MMLHHDISSIFNVLFCYVRTISFKKINQHRLVAPPPPPLPPPHTHPTDSHWKNTTLTDKQLTKTRGDRRPKGGGGGGGEGGDIYIYISSVTD